MCHFIEHKTCSFINDGGVSRVVTTYRIINHCAKNFDRRIHCLGFSVQLVRAIWVPFELIKCSVDLFLLHRAPSFVFLINMVTVDFIIWLNENLLPVTYRLTFAITSIESVQSRAIADCFTLLSYFHLETDTHNWELNLDAINSINHR